MERRTRWAQKAVDIFGDYKLTGVGVGNFPYAYPMYQSPEDKLLFITHLTNDWVEFLVDAGIIGFGLFIAGMVYFVFRTMKLWRKRKDPFAISIGAAAFAVMTAIGIHSWVDYNLHIPANFLMLTAITAIGYSALHLEKRRNRERSLYQYHVIPLRWRGTIILALAVGGILWTGAGAVRHFMAEAYCMTVPNHTLKRDYSPPLEEIKKAIKWDGRNAKYWWKLARELMRIRNRSIRFLMMDRGFMIGDAGDGMQDRDKIQGEIVQALEEAVRLNPFEVDYHMELGWQYLRLANGIETDQKWLHSADLSMERAAYFVKKSNPYQHIILGDYWLNRTKMISPTDSDWEVFWSKVRWHYRKNLSLESVHNRKERIKHIRGKIWSHYPDEAFVRKVLNGEQSK